MKRTPLVTAAALAVLVGTAALATAAPSSGSNDTRLMPKAKPVHAAVISDDAIYTLSETTSSNSRVTQLYTRTLSEPQPELVLTGQAVLVGRASGYGMAENDGTLAFTSTDGTLALRAEDGTITKPAWGTAEEFAGNPVAMSDRWIAAGSSVFDRTSGAEHDLAALTAEVLDEAADVFTTDIDVVDDRAVWLAVAESPTTHRQTQGIFTVELGEDGPVGLPVELQDGAGLQALTLAGFTGDAVAWAVTTPGTSSAAMASAVRWVAQDAVDQPYSEVSVAATQRFGGVWADETGVTVAGSGLYAKLQTIGLNGAEAPAAWTHSVTFESVLDVQGPFIARTLPDGTSRLTDTLGRQIRNAPRN